MERCSAFGACILQTQTAFLEFLKRVSSLRLQLGVRQDGVRGLEERGPLRSDRGLRSVCGASCSCLAGAPGATCSCPGAEGPPSPRIPRAQSSPWQERPNPPSVHLGPWTAAQAQSLSQALSRWPAPSTQLTLCGPLRGELLSTRGAGRAEGGGREGPTAPLRGRRPHRRACCQHGPGPGQPRLSADKQPKTPGRVGAQVRILRGFQTPEARSPGHEGYGRVRPGRCPTLEPLRLERAPPHPPGETDWLS